MSKEKDTVNCCAGLLLIAGLCLLCGGGALCWLVGGLPYSEGHREGTVQKLGVGR